ncbi:uncharacterized protein LOC133549488 isoform X4 [Nerophis ophidion]|uniref:uncharacterized protein LOC133549488 isoform X4 n=1 Tax=Nerophis ophidion TaxID=159077 RepID=UPI002ADF15F7|nr:uncharacterized protein LOC133549488 isoform X4 [Nerophis ophidion]
MYVHAYTPYSAVRPFWLQLHPALPQQRRRLAALHGRPFRCLLWLLGVCHQKSQTNCQERNCRRRRRHRQDGVVSPCAVHAGLQRPVQVRRAPPWFLNCRSVTFQVLPQGVRDLSEYQENRGAGCGRREPEVGRLVEILSAGVAGRKAIGIRCKDVWRGEAGIVQTVRGGVQ